jgi:hypothetical protein
LYGAAPVTGKIWSCFPHAIRTALCNILALDLALAAVTAAQNILSRVVIRRLRERLEELRREASREASPATAALLVPAFRKKPRESGLVDWLEQIHIESGRFCAALVVGVGVASQCDEEMAALSTATKLPCDLVARETRQAEIDDRRINV